MSDNSQEKSILLNEIYKIVQNGIALEEIFHEIETKLLRLMDADRITLYRREGQDLVSWFLSGNDVDTPIHVPIAPTSISGYVGLTGEPLRITNVYDNNELEAIHPELSFDYTYDQNSGYLTRSMVCVPIEYNETVLGAIQFINRKTASEAFSDQDVIHAIAVSQLISNKFRHDMRSGGGPFDLLVKTGKLPPEKLDELQLEANERGIPVTILLKRRLKIPIEEIGKSLESHYEAPFMPYDPEFHPDHEILENYNRSYLASNNWCPFRGVDNDLIIMIDNPQDTDRMMEIEQLLGYSGLEFRVGTREDILRYLGYAFEEDEDRKELNLDELVDRLEEKTINVDSSEGEELYDENASVIIQLVNRIIIEAVKSSASDIHVEPSKGKKDAVVRMRIDGECIEKLLIPHNYIRAVVARIKVLSNLDISERRRPQDGKMAVRMEGRPLELRIATVPTVNGETAVMRVLASGGAAMSMERLNFHPTVFDKLIEMQKHPHGIILVVGPTGSGKTTTLHSILGKLNQPEKKILTAEDPVEITQHGLQQLQVNAKIGLTFASALRSFLRADPDIILIGEMRDHETASIGVEASLTGHMVLSTLHTNSAPETVVRLLDMGLDPLNFADAFIGVLAQRLVRTLCSSCKEPYKPSKEELDKLVHLYGREHFSELNINLDEVTLYRPRGCEKCGNTGYRGRTGIHELIVSTGKMKKCIAKSAPVDQIRDLAVEEGMRSLFQDGVYKIFKGDTDLAQLRKVTAG
ncbi:MAG: Flp pilus assembly complex ATPase component TadA [Lentisphaeria bacterium]|nr:Flp pilus assembly complex ATPase component TadA [Lentisphaeria bacterium]